MFDDFVLEPSRLNPNSILLNWKQLGSDYVLGPHQMSDGSLRAVALIAALLQPDDNLPDLLVLDEPELGLHPYAISILAGLIRAASSKTQVVVSTQSAALVDEFAAEEVIVVESENQQSRFRRLDPEMLKDWLSEYSLGELWEKNVIGGGPLS
jgi:predicted ATPase